LPLYSVAALPPFELCHARGNHSALGWAQMTTGEILRKDECCRVFAVVLDISRLYACCAACELAIAPVENLALVERDGIEQALLGDVVN